MTDDKWIIVDWKPSKVKPTRAYEKKRQRCNEFMDILAKCVDDGEELVCHVTETYRFGTEESIAQSEPPTEL